MCNKLQNSIHFINSNETFQKYTRKFKWKIDISQLNLWASSELILITVRWYWTFHDVNVFLFKFKPLRNTAIHHNKHTHLVIPSKKKIVTLTLSINRKSRYNFLLHAPETAHFPQTTLVRNLEFPAANTQIRLFRYIHFSETSSKRPFPAKRKRELCKQIFPADCFPRRWKIARLPGGSIRVIYSISRTTLKKANWISIW